MEFSRARLEGRALEHAIAGNSGSHIRMLSDDGCVVIVRSEQAAAATVYMKERYTQLKAQLSEKGILCQGGDKVVRLSEEDAAEVSLRIAELSVDLVVWCQTLQASVLVEVKWSRANFSNAVERGIVDLPKLKAACFNGRWKLSRKMVTAKYYGLLTVSPGQWALLIHCSANTWSASLDSSSPPAPTRIRSSGASNWVAWRGDVAPGARPWWPSGKSGRKRRRAL